VNEKKAYCYKVTIVRKEINKSKWNLFYWIIVFQYIEQNFQSNKTFHVFYFFYASDNIYS